MGSEICSLKIRVSMDNFKVNDRRSLCRTLAGGVFAISWCYLLTEGKLRGLPIHGSALRHRLKHRKTIEFKITALPECRYSCAVF
jgi:hypothetical protein